MRKKKCTMSIPEIIKMYESGSRNRKLEQKKPINEICDSVQII
jgi:hypothetical protein